MEERLPNIHPDEVLEEEFLQPLHMSASRLAQAIRLPQRRFEKQLTRIDHFQRMPG